MIKLLIIPFLLMLSGCGQIDLGMVGGSIMSVWIAYNFWSLVAVAVVMMVGSVLWKLAVQPSQPAEREAWKQNGQNKIQAMPPQKRLARKILLFSFSFMASSLFCIAVFQMFN